MANHLTGDYDAVILIRVATINALLATLHQNGGDKNVSPSFLHVARLRIGGPIRSGTRTSATSLTGSTGFLLKPAVGRPTSADSSIRPRRV